MPELTDRFCQKAKPTTGLQAEFFDTVVRGLSLVASKGGTKSFYLTYTRPADGKRARLKLGRYPTLTLAGARQKARDARGGLDQGTDPLVEKRAEGASPTVADLTAAYVKAKGGLRTISEIQRRLEKNIVAIIGHVRLSDLHRRDATRCFDRMLERDANVEANRTFEDFRALTRWARGRGDLDHNIMDGVRPPFVKAERLGDDEEEEGRILDRDEIRHLWFALPDAPFISESVARILKLMLLTGCRVSEISEMQESEIHWDEKVLRLPKARVKNKTAFVVPLSELALDLLREQIAKNKTLADRMKRQPGTAVFPGRSGRGSISNQVVGRAIDRTRTFGADRVELTVGLPYWTSHAMRRTAGTLMETAGISPFIVAHVLNHKWVTKATITSKLYAKYDYGREKREAINTLEAVVCGIIEGGADVVALRSA